MNPVNFRPAPHPMPPWVPMLPPDLPRSSMFWDTMNISNRLKELQDTLNLAKAMEKELEVLMMLKDTKGSIEDVEQGSSAPSVSECLKYLEDSNTNLESQEGLSVEAANSLMSRLRTVLEPFKFVVDESTPWEEKSAVVRLASKMKKSKRNKLWRKRKRQRVAEMQAQELERFDQADREADEWRAREMAKDNAKSKVEEMKAIEKVKAKRERKRLEPELELALIVEELQNLRSLRIEKLKKQGHFLPEEDDKFFESVRAAVEQEENEAQSPTNTEVGRNAEESKKNSQSTMDVPMDATISNTETNKNRGEANHPAVDSDKQGPEAYDNSGNLPFEFYHYYYGSNYDMGRLIEVRREWDVYIRPGASRIPGHWVQPPPPANEVWASYLVKPN